MLSVPRITLEALSGEGSPNHLSAMSDGHLEAVRAGKLAAYTIDRSAAPLLLGEDFVSHLTTLEQFVSALSFPHFLENQLKHQEDADNAARYCFAAINGLLGRTPRGRQLQVLRNRPMITHGGNMEVPHWDVFDGISVHVQGPVIENRERHLKIGLRGSDEAVDTVRLKSVEQGITKPTIWHGPIRERDVTILNSGLTLPSGEYVQSVHQFTTDYPNPAPGQVIQTFSQFIEVA